MKNKIVFLLLFSLVSFAAISQDVAWHNNVPSIDITPQLQTLEDAGGKLSFEQIQSSGYRRLFKSPHKPILNFGFTESVYWLRFHFAETSSQKLYLEIAHAFLPVTDLYYKDSTGKTVVMHAGYLIPVKEKIVANHLQVFPLPAGQHDFYIRLISNSHPIRATIYTESAYDIKTYQQRLVYGFYLGFMFFVILSNLFLYFSLRNRLHLFYAIVVLMYISYAAMVMDGFIVYFVPHINLMFWYITIPTIGTPLQVTYALIFLDVKKYSPRLYRFTVCLIAYFVFYTVVKIWFPLTAVLAINTVHALISFFTMGYLGYVTGKRGNRLGYYFALAYFIYFLLVLTEATYIQLGTPAYLFEISYVSLATLIEAAILSFLLSKRFEFEKEETEGERHEAQHQLLEKTRENERIVKEQNVLLEQRVKERTKALNHTVENLKDTQAKLIQSEKLASLGELTAGIAHEIQNPLNFVNNFADINKELLAELKDEAGKGNLDEVNAIADNIISNEEKINYHGRRADAIVKNMLQHSRKNTGQKEPTDINALCDEYLRLSFHGLRAKDKNFNADFKVDFDESIGKINIVPQDIGRVLLNLFNNAFYAVRSDIANKGNLYKPCVTISTKKINPANNEKAVNFSSETRSIEIIIADNGTGISPFVIDKIFQPFFTTKPTGEGTGLGLSMSYDIITKEHGGTIQVESTEGKGTRFIIMLPV